MAITINSTPNTLTPYPSMHDANWFVVTSDNVNQTSFKYVFDIYIGGNIVARVKAFPQIGTNKGIVNVSNIIRNYWSSYFKPILGTSTAFNYQGSDNYITYDVKFGEEYGGTTYTNLTIGTDYTAFNYISDYLPWTGDFYFENTYLGGLLTNRDIRYLKTTLVGNPLFITGINEFIDTPVNWSLSVRTYNGNTWSSFTSGGNYSVSDIVLIDISPYALNAYLGTSKITSTTTNYEVKIIRNAIEIFTCSVEIVCVNKFTPVSIVFLNEVGGYDTMLFDLINKQSRTNEKKQYNSIEWEYNPVSLRMERYDTHGKFYGGANTFFLEQTINYKLISNYITLEDYNWLKQLINSTEVYIYDNGYYMPIVITTNTWTEKKRYTDKIYNLELDIQLGSKVNSQFR